MCVCKTGDDERIGRGKKPRGAYRAMVISCRCLEEKEGEMPLCGCVLWRGLGALDRGYCSVRVVGGRI